MSRALVRPPAAVVRLGALKKAAAIAPPVAAARPQVAFLDKACAGDVLMHLRAEKERSGASLLPVRGWLDTVPVTAGLPTIAQAEKAVEQALLRLQHLRHAKITRSRSARWALHEWVVEVL